MTTTTGIVTDSNEQFNSILDNTKLKDWAFFVQPQQEIYDSFEIKVPSMTVSERLELDKKLFDKNGGILTEEFTQFKYGVDDDEHRKYIDGYRDYYKYLPYFGKVTY